MIIDFHTHAWPAKVSLKAKEQLEKLYGLKLAGDPTVETLLRFMDKNGIGKSVICAVASRPEQVESINSWLFGVKSERLEIFCSIHSECKKMDYLMCKIKENRGGIKIQPEFQQIFIDSERMFKIYEHAEKLGIPILFHSGEELSASGTLHSTPEKIINIKSKFPGLIIIAAHYGGFRVWDEVVKHLLGADIYLDTSFFFGFLPANKVKIMLKGHRNDRILFGTDFPLVDQQNDIEFLSKLDIDAGLKERIFYKNADSLLESMLA